MTDLLPWQLACLLCWGTLAGVDLVTFPQALLSRPLVVGAGTGLLIGDPVTGLQVGLVLELFALDVLPVGASRYPDYGPGLVGAVVLASGGALHHNLGVATLFALGCAGLGGWSLLWLRQVNGRALERHAAGLAAGSAATIATVQYRGVASDVIRSALLTAANLGVALWLSPGSLWASGWSWFRRWQWAPRWPLPPRAPSGAPAVRRGSAGSPPAPAWGS